MIYPSEPVSSVLMCSEIVGFGFSICFSSSAVCLSFDSSILSLSSCCIEINFSLTSYIQFWSISFCSLSSLSLLSGILASLPHTVGHTFLSVLQEHVCLDALSFIFVLVLFNLSSSVWTFHLLWLRKSLTLFPKSLITVPFKLERKAHSSLSFHSFALRFWEEGWKI